MIEHGEKLKRAYKRLCSNFMRANIAYSFFGCKDYICHNLKKQTEKLCCSRKIVMAEHLLFDDKQKRI